MQTLTKNKFYLTLILSVLIVSTHHAQIVYTDVIPDQTFNNNGVYQLDLNNDGITDFNISYTVAFPGPCGDIAQLNYFIRIMPVHPNSVANDSLFPVYPLKLDSNSIIDRYLVWKKDPNQLLFSMTWLCPSEYWIGYANGNWINTTHNFLPLKLRVAGNSYFGWLGIDVDGYPTSFGSFRIKDYAFNTIAGQPILAGETTCTEPAVTVTNNGPLTFCIGDSVVLSANTNAYKYQWKKNGVNIAGANSSTYVATTAGTYKVKVTNSCGSKTSKSKTVVTPCRLNQAISLADQFDQLAVYPNPAANSVTVHLPTDEESIVQVLNGLGETVYSIKTTSAEIQIDLSHFAAGLYSLRWTNGEYHNVKTFSVVR